MANPAIISVIDDDPSIRKVLKSLLRSCGWEVHTFASAEDYLSSLQLNDTACLISDVQMPGLGGIGLQRVLAARGHSTPVIFITAFPDPQTRRRLLHAGALCVLDKPFDDQTLIQHIDAALKRSGSLSP